MSEKIEIPDELKKYIGANIGSEIDNNNASYVDTSEKGIPKDIPDDLKKYIFID